VRPFGVAELGVRPMICKRCHKPITEQTSSLYRGKCIPCFKKTSPYLVARNTFMFIKVVISGFGGPIQNIISCLISRIPKFPRPWIPYVQENYNIEESVHYKTVELGELLKLHFPSIYMDGSATFHPFGKCILLTFRVQGKGCLGETFGFKKLIVCSNQNKWHYNGEYVGHVTEAGKNSTYIYEIPIPDCINILSSHKPSFRIGSLHIINNEKILRAISTLSMSMA
jgi:hypothetical protein